MTNRTYSIDAQSWADLSMYETRPISHFKGPTSDFRLGWYNYPRNVLSRFYHFLTWRKTAIYIGFPNYIHAFICVKSLYCLQDKGLKMVVFLYMDMHMQLFMHLCVDMWMDVEYSFDYRIIWFIELNLIIEIQNQNQKSQSKIRFIFSKMIFDIVKSGFEN